LNVAQGPAFVAKELGLDEAELETRLGCARAKLHAVRELRPKPHRDEKIVTAWNGLMIASLAETGRVLGRGGDLEAARRSADFILSTMVIDGRLRHGYKDGPSSVPGFLDDYAALVDGLVRLYEATFEPRYVEAALALADGMLEDFADAETGSLSYTGRHHEALIYRSQNPYDNAVPSGQSLAATALLRLWALTGRDVYREQAERTLASLAPLMARAALGFGHLLAAAELALRGPVTAVVAAPRAEAMTGALGRILAGTLRADLVLAHADAANPGTAQTMPLLAGRTPLAGRPAVYLCRQFACERPLDDAAELSAALGTA